MSLSIAERRKLLFTPCKTRDHFKLWVKEFLNIDLPDCTVSDESNSNPLDAAWEYYKRTLDNDLVGHSRVMSYANRGGFKTVSASILETMVLLHTERNVAHMAAIESQSKISAAYVKSFFALETLRDFVISSNSRDITVVRHIHKKTGEVLTDKEWTALPAKKKLEYVKYDNYLKIVLATMQSANGAHVEFFCVDELDVIPKQNIPAYQQAQNIPDPRDGMLPLMLLTSTRKSRTGLVQFEIDNSERTGLKILHWNLIDTTAACEPVRHQPELPKQTYYINDEELKHISPEEYEILNPGQQKKWYPKEGFAGCAKCLLFPACKGRLATEQKATSPMLKPIEFSLGKFQSAPSADFIATEYLCRKPDTSGLVYPRLSKETHVKSAAEMAKLMTDEDFPAIFSKVELIKLLKSKGAEFFAGMDFGFTHNFAVVTFARYAQYVFVLDCYMQSGLALEEQVANSEYLKNVYGNPPIWPDPAYPGSIKTFRNKGFKAKNWEKKPFSVKAGIEIVRTLMWNARGVTRLYFLRGDPGIEILFKNLENYKFRTDMAGRPTEEPDEADDDAPDALRYALMNELGNKGAIIDTSLDAIKTTDEPVADEPANYLQDFLRKELGAAPENADKPVIAVKRGRLTFSQ